MDWIAILFGVVAWQKSELRCKNPHYKTANALPYLEAAGYNLPRQDELNQLASHNMAEINRLLDRDREPLERNPKNSWWNHIEDVKAILQQEGYKYFNLHEAIRDPLYRKITNLNYYEKKQPDKYLASAEVVREYEQKYTEEVAKNTMAGIGLIAYLVLILFVVPPIFAGIVIRFHWGDDIVVPLIILFCITAVVAPCLPFIIDIAQHDAKIKRDRLLSEEIKAD